MFIHNGRSYDTFRFFIKSPEEGRLVRPKYRETRQVAFAFAVFNVINVNVCYMLRYSPVLRTRSRQTSESPLWESCFAAFIDKVIMNNRQKEEHGTARQGIIGESQSQ